MPAYLGKLGRDQVEKGEQVLPEVDLDPQRQPRSDPGAPLGLRSQIRVSVAEVEVGAAGESREIRAVCGQEQQCERLLREASRELRAVGGSA
jgi:hypothetical protein